MEIYNILERFRPIRNFIFDVDGVLTDNRIVVFENGDFVRIFNVRDGEVMKRALRYGFRIAIITGGRSEGVVKRLVTLGIPEPMIYKGVFNKIEAFDDLCFDHHFDPATTLYMGDDLPDIPVMKKVALPTAPADAVPEVLAAAEYISPLKGGNGCVRDVIEKVLKLNGKWEF